MVLRTPGTLAGLLVGLLALVGFTRALTWAMDTQSYNTWGAMLWVPAIIAANAVLLAHVIRREADPAVGRVLVLGFSAKLIGIAGRYLVTYFYYGGTADAERYNLYAVDHYLDWRAGNVVWEESTRGGTQLMELITTGLYTVIGPSVITAFFIFGLAAFWGVYLVFRAAKVALPQLDHHRYAWLLFLLPSILYWPSSIGKEAYLMLFVGAIALGAAHFFTGRTTTGLVLLGAGIVGSAIVRPHITVMLVTALFIAQVVRPTTKRSTSLITKAAGLFVMGVAAAILATQSAEFLGIDDFSLQEIADSYDYRSGNTEQGGSVFEPVPIASPLGIPAAIVTLLFRPFPWEAASVPMFFQSLEGVILLVITLFALPRLRALPSLLRRNAFLVFALVYALGFMVAFSGFGNFGILARQRVLMLPFFLLVLALPVTTTTTKLRGVRRKELAHAEGW